jgi:pyridoxamine 5'-phosphate oxidase
MSEDLKSIREEDPKTPLIEGDDPFALFDKWFASARANEPGYPNAMTVATVDDTGMPDARIVLLKGFDEDGFVFFTNTLSVKGRQLGSFPKAALCFYWGQTQRQVRIRGPVTSVSTDEADTYFASRPRGSQIGAWASSQSQPLTNRDDFIEQIESVEGQYQSADVPRPPHWSGYRVAPLKMEFWQERPFRLHDRLVFEREIASADWRMGRIYP